MRSRTALNGEKGAGKTIVDDVYSEMRHKILAGALGAGSSLKFNTLRDTFNVSMGTLREALIRLENDRLVTSIEQKGFKVASLSLAEMREVMWLRAELGVLALTDAIRHGDEMWEANIVSVFHRLSKIAPASIDGSDEIVEKIEEIHRAFHRSILASCTSPWLLNFYEILDEHALRYRRIRLTTSRPKLLRMHFVREHRDIMKAVLARDVSKAAKLLRSHFQKTQIAIEANFTESRPEDSVKSNATEKIARVRG